MNKYKATKNDEGRTILKFIQKLFNDVPKSRIERIFRQKDIKINGARINDKKYLIHEKDEIIIYGLFTNFEPKKNIKANITFKIIFEDKNILIVDKKTGVSVHDDKNSLDNQVLAYLKFKQIDSFVTSHIGRLDKQTSGIMIYGKTYEAVKQLNSVNKKLTKIYEFKSDLNQDIITEYKITHDENYHREKAGNVGKKTKTKFWIEGNKKYAQLITGRKHQIRASLSKLNKPIYGDTKYGGKKAARIYLHSVYLKLDGLNGKLSYLNGQEFWSKPEW